MREKEGKGEEVGIRREEGRKRDWGKRKKR